MPYANYLVFAGLAGASWVLYAWRLLTGFCSMCYFRAIKGIDISLAGSLLCLAEICFFLF